jgi:hypothetical protein
MGSLNRAKKKVEQDSQVLVSQHNWYGFNKSSWVSVSADTEENAIKMVASQLGLHCSKFTVKPL